MMAMFSSTQQLAKTLLLLLVVTTTSWVGIPTAVTAVAPKPFLKIVGGAGVKITQFPFAANIHLRSFSSCGGTIISDRWILTAAHCLIDAPASSRASANVYYNLSSITLNLGSTLNTTATPIIPKQLIVHPKYSYTGTLFDGGLIELAQPLVFNDDVQPIKLAVANDYFKNSQVFTVVGWGRNEANQKSSYLQRVDLPIVKEDVCRKAHPSYEKNRNQLMCVGHAVGRDTCRGDSGGPLLLEVISAEGTTGTVAAQSWLQVGVTSFGANALGLDANICGVDGSVGYYSRGDFLTPWITSVTGLAKNQFTAALPETFIANKSDDKNNATTSNTVSQATSSNQATYNVGSFTYITVLASLITILATL
ncbi:trypsin-like cysteine/serine peptidase domain-containing protein [Syncephalis fuscata]|nr:trypsin-like cysteine/serine peptidase domain-containing protein [Syncephalis fuscata]